MSATDPQCPECGASADSLDPGCDRMPVHRHGTSLCPGSMLVLGSWGGLGPAGLPEPKVPR
jgi:hypothetical protein